MKRDIPTCFKKVSLGLDLRSAATEDHACQVRCAPELREDWDRLTGRQENNATACDSDKERTCRRDRAVGSEPSGASLGSMASL